MCIEMKRRRKRRNRDMGKLEEKKLEEKQEEKKGKMCSDCLLYSARYVLHYYIFRLDPCLL